MWSPFENLSFKDVFETEHLKNSLEQVAYHEAGHAVLAILRFENDFHSVQIENCSSVHPSGRVKHMNPDNRVIFQAAALSGNRQKLDDYWIMTLGGIVAEYIQFKAKWCGRAASGPNGDFDYLCVTFNYLETIENHVINQPKQLREMAAHAFQDLKTHWKQVETIAETLLQMDGEVRVLSRYEVRQLIHM
jgi:hypothetical protein